MDGINCEKKFLRCEIDDRIVCLSGENLAEEKQRIEEEIKSGKKPIFILKMENGGKISNYIDNMYDEHGLSNKILTKFMLCKYIDFKNLVTLVARGNGDYRPQNIEELISILLKFTDVSIVIENDNRTLLADILQQLIYIEYPIDKIDIKLRKEFKDAEKTKKFMNKVKELREYTIQALGRLNELSIEAPTEEEKNKLLKIKEDTLESYKKIREQIEKANNVEMKIALAASKKTGKSVLANSMIKMELAPTSLELATPNTCTYKKSNDDKFRLIYGGKENIFEFSEDVYEAVQKEFKKAQDDKENKYLIPNMEIQYVSKTNNFDSYTIFDTPGPDAAGTDHYKATNEAIEKCDVAIFAIDYSKYLTSSEEQFLGKVKEIFESKGKFHTLIFTINKIDMALQDKGAKSRIKSIDYIRNRIMEIDEKYKDCVIFATSARDYFYTLELEEAAQGSEVCKELLDKDLYTCLRSAIGELDDNEQKIRDLLSKIDSEAGMLAIQLGYDKVYLDTIKNYSGMPQLLSYVSYVIKSKAREEIVNSITSAINTETSRLTTIINNTSNIQRLINENELKIESIGKVLNKYYNDVAEILNKDCILHNDLKELDKEKEKIFFDNINAYTDRYENDKDIDIDKLLELYRKGIKEHSADGIQKKIVDNIVIEWKNKAEELKEKFRYIEAEKLSPDEEVYAKSWESSLKNFREEILNKQEKNFHSLIENLRKIRNKRVERVEVLSNRCKEELEKENCSLEFPSLPSFDISFPNVDSSIQKLKKQIPLYEFKDKRIFREEEKQDLLSRCIKFMTGGLISPHYKSDKMIDLSLLDDDRIEKFGEEIRAIALRWVVYDSGVVYVFDGLKEKMMKIVQDSQEKIKKIFEDSNREILGNIKAFKDVIDDTKSYKNNNAALERTQTLIKDIELASEEFMCMWKDIIKDEEKEE